MMRLLTMAFVGSRRELIARAKPGEGNAQSTFIQQLLRHLHLAAPRLLCGNGSPSLFVTAAPFELGNVSGDMPACRCFRIATLSPYLSDIRPRTEIRRKV